VRGEGAAEQLSVTRVDSLPGVELLEFSGTNRRMGVITDGVWLGTAGLRTRDRSWARNRYRGRPLDLAGADLALIEPNEAIQCEAASGDMDLVVLVVDTGYLARLLGETRSPFARARVRDSQLDAGFWQAVCAISDGDADALEREALTDALLVMAHERHAERAPPRAPPGRTPVARARELIEACHDQRLTLDRIAEAAGLSKYHLARKFRDEIGVPVHRYVRLRRAREALRRLRRGEAPADTALACGFTDQAHLTRVLRQTIGFTPAAYRAKVQ